MGKYKIYENGKVIDVIEETCYEEAVEDVLMFKHIEIEEV